MAQTWVALKWTRQSGTRERGRALVDLNRATALLVEINERTLIVAGKMSRCGKLCVWGGGGGEGGGRLPTSLSPVSDSTVSREVGAPVDYA